MNYIMRFPGLTSNILPLIDNLHTGYYKMDTNSSICKTDIDGGVRFVSVPGNGFLYFLSRDLFYFYSNYRLLFSFSLLNYIPVVNQVFSIVQFSQSNGSQDFVSFLFGVKCISSTEFKYIIQLRHNYGSSVVEYLSSSTYLFSSLISFQEYKFYYSNDGIITFELDSEIVSLGNSTILQSYNPSLAYYNSLLRFGQTSALSASIISRYSAFSFLPLISSTPEDAFSEFCSYASGGSPYGVSQSWNSLISQVNDLYSVSGSVSGLSEEYLTKFQNFLDSLTDDGYLNKFLKYTSDSGQTLYGSDDWKYFSALLHESLSL